MAPTPVVTELPTGADKTRRVRAMFDAIAPRYELANRVLSLGLDARWRTTAVRALGLPTDSLVLDVATGTGSLSAVAARLGHRVVGFDLSMGMLEASSSQAPTVQCDAAALPVGDAVADGVVCGYALRNFTSLPDSLAEMSRALRPGGRIALLEVGDPSRPLTRAGYELWFNHAVPFIGGVISNRDAYRYLPRSVAYLPSPNELRDLVRAAGFSGVNRHLLSGGLSQLYTATKEGRP
jgi:demethylmenaquinone methyltransferase/2-methoxy-6-polyprenyl-1,4-benzoquinol methylase